MLHCFRVREYHRNYLRFLWYRDNNPDNDLIEYRMCVHVFGNSPSPAIATCGLRKAAETAKELYEEDVFDFVENNFYDDDGLVSLPKAEEAVDLMLRTQRALQTCGNLCLHKIASNSSTVFKAFLSDDRSKDLKDLNFGTEEYPLQRSLGMSWDINQDTFTFSVPQEGRPFTKRGALSTINSLFDPLGIAAPVVIQGKIILRDLMSTKLDWDDPLPPEHKERSDRWKDALQHLKYLNLPCTYTGKSLKTTANKEVHVYCDASEKAIAAVAYLTSGTDGIGFIPGKSKVAPSHGHTIPRLELCAAVLGVNIGQLVANHLKIPPNQIHYYTDSRIVLGYLSNDTKRFSVYVTNRVSHVRIKEQWHYVPTDCNPADQGTRSVSASNLSSSTWLTGPPKPVQINSNPYEFDQGNMPEITVVTNQAIIPPRLGSHRFSRFSSWLRLTQAIDYLQQFVRQMKDLEP